MKTLRGYLSVTRARLIPKVRASRHSATGTTFPTLFEKWYRDTRYKVVEVDVAGRHRRKRARRKTLYRKR